MIRTPVLDPRLSHASFRTSKIGIQPSSAMPQSPSSARPQQLGPAPVIARGPTAAAAAASRPQTSSARSRTRPSHECQICKKRFTKRSNMLIHERLHTGEKPYVCSHGCGKRYSWLSSINFHETRCAARLGRGGGGGDDPDTPNPPSRKTDVSTPCQGQASTVANKTSTTPSTGADTSTGNATANTNACSGAVTTSIATISRKQSVGRSANPSTAAKSKRPRPSGPTTSKAAPRPSTSAPSKKRAADAINRAHTSNRKKPRTLSTPTQTPTQHPQSPTSVRSVMSDELDALLAGQHSLFASPVCSYPHPHFQPSIAPPAMAMYHHHQPRQQQQQQQPALSLPQQHHAPSLVHLGASHPQEPFFGLDVIPEPLTPQAVPIVTSQGQGERRRLVGHHQRYPQMAPSMEHAVSQPQPSTEDPNLHQQSLPCVSSPVTPAHISHQNGGPLKSEILLDDFCLAGVDLFGTMAADAAPPSDVFGEGFVLDSGELNIF